MKDNIIIYVSSYNNYDMLEEVVLKNINTEGFEFINVDDNSFPEELEKGKAVCKKHGIQCLENKFLLLYTPPFYGRYIDDILTVLKNNFNTELLTNNNIFHKLTLNEV